jgi:hypothetical protein
LGHTIPRKEEVVVGEEEAVAVEHKVTRLRKIAK